MKLSELRSIALRKAIDETGIAARLNEAADDDDEKKKKSAAKKKGDENPDDQDTDTEENNDEDTQTEEPQDDDNNTEEEENQDGEGEETEEQSGENPDGDEPPAEDGEETTGEENDQNAGTDTGEDMDGGGGDDDFSLDSDDPEGGGDDEGPAPDGLPEADDDGSGDTGTEEQEETNVQTNILQLSKLDRALAKKMVGENYTSLRSTIRAAIGVLDRNEAILDPDVRQDAADSLNNILTELEAFIMYKFPLLNYEDALTQYLVFAKKVNEKIEYVRNDGISKHKS